VAFLACAHPNHNPVFRPERLGQGNRPSDASDQNSLTLGVVNELVLAVLPNTSLIDELSVPLTAPGPPAVRLALESAIFVTVSFTVTPLTEVLTVTSGEVPPVLV
jgi:hypothetical protein